MRLEDVKLLWDVLADGVGDGDGEIAVGAQDIGRDGRPLVHGEREVCAHEHVIRCA